MPACYWLTHSVSAPHASTPQCLSTPSPPHPQTTARSPAWRSPRCQSRGSRCGRPGARRGGERGEPIRGAAAATPGLAEVGPKARACVPPPKAPQGAPDPTAPHHAPPSPQAAPALKHSQPRGARRAPPPRSRRGWCRARTPGGWSRRSSCVRSRRRPCPPTPWGGGGGGAAHSVVGAPGTVSGPLDAGARTQRGPARPLAPRMRLASLAPTPAAHHGHHGAAADVVHQRGEEGLGRQVGVVLLGGRLLHVDHLRARGRAVVGARRSAGHAGARRAGRRARVRAVDGRRNLPAHPASTRQRARNTLTLRARSV